MCCRFTHHTDPRRLLPPQLSERKPSANARNATGIRQPSRPAKPLTKSPNSAAKTAAAAERELKESARKASEGWKQKEKEDREKARQSR